MKAFFKENSTLALGLGLPLMLVFLLWGATEWAQRNTVPPQYDFLFATNYYEYGAGLRFAVENGKLQASYVAKGASNRPTLYRYLAKESIIKEIPFTIPSGLTVGSGTPADTSSVTPIAIPEIESLTLDASIISPDGFTYENSYQGRPIFGDIFFGGSGRSRYSVMLTKGGYRKHIPVNDSYSYSQKFIGWIIP